MDVDTPIYVLGNFDQNVTVLSQQTRALNLAWALVESGLLPSPGAPPLKVAIVGAGFAGLTMAAALLQKRVAVEITIFEERDTLLPLQLGSDSRWLHPHIYDWPTEGSEASSAMSPVLNWTAARASDVVVQVLGAWRRIVCAPEVSLGTVKLFCATRHLQIDSIAGLTKLRVEWTGEGRDPCDGTSFPQGGPTGSAEVFDHVILAVGFGLERGKTHSYWRNETFGQPSLEQGRATFIVSGQGDGAMIDLLRLCISQYRQDRILDELFGTESAVLTRLRKLKEDFGANPARTDLFSKFEEMFTDPATCDGLSRACDQLRRRLRRDVDALLRMKVRNLATLFNGQTSRMSFQNATLIYLLYKVGGFAPTSEAEGRLIQRLGVSADHVIRRHGTDRGGQFSRILSEDLLQRLPEPGSSFSGVLKQTSDALWSGGYFGIPTRLSEIDGVGETVRATWRKEYLPGATSLLATALSGALAGELGNLQPEATHFRLTLHRVLRIHGETLLQQMCEYTGRGVEKSPAGAGRTFPYDAATIGLAYVSRKTVRSRKGASAGAIQTAMSGLKLDDASRPMNEAVAFVVAMPILQPPTAASGGEVVGVLFIDSRWSGFWLADVQLQQLADLITGALNAVAGATEPFERIRSIGEPRFGDSADEVREPPDDLEYVDLDPPRSSKSFAFAFESSDLTPFVASDDPARTISKGESLDG